jgi:hypothetical protein
VAAEEPFRVEDDARREPGDPDLRRRRPRIGATIVEGLVDDDLVSSDRDREAIAALVPHPQGVHRRIPLSPPAMQRRRA